MEANRKKVQVHMLPTNGKDIAMLSKRVKDGMLQSANGTEGVANCNTMWQPQHLYFTDDSEIKEGDWFYDEDINEVRNDDYIGGINIYKIIASTDPKLETSDEVFHNTYKQKLPQPSQAFIKAYCEQGGIDWVDVEYEKPIDAIAIRGGGSFTFEVAIRQAILGLKPIIDSVHNTITTHRIVEKMYSRDKMIELCKKAFAQGEKGEGCTALYKSFDEWIKENL